MCETESFSTGLWSSCQSWISRDGTVEPSLHIVHQVWATRHVCITKEETKKTECVSWGKREGEGERERERERERETDLSRERVDKEGVDFTLPSRIANDDQYASNVPDSFVSMGTSEALLYHDGSRQHGEELGSRSQSLFYNSLTSRNSRVKTESREAGMSLVISLWM